MPTRQIHRRASWGSPCRSAGLGLLILLALLYVPARSQAQPPTATTPARANSSDDFLARLNLTSDRGPVTISAKELEFDYESRRLVYRGSVRVTQGDLTLDSERLTVTLDQDTPETVREVLAEGKVRIAQGQRIATGGRAVFDQASRTVVLSDAAVLREGQNEVAGERVVVYLDEKRSIVEGGDRRVRAVFFPPSDGSPTKTTAAAP